MTLYDLPNMTGGVDDNLVQLVATVPIFIPALLFFIWCIIFMGGSSAQKRRNGYADYNGIGSYIIPGSAGSVDSNPYTLQSSPDTTTSIETTTPTTTTPLVSALDNALFALISFEIAVVAIIICIRRSRPQTIK